MTSAICDSDLFKFTWKVLRLRQVSIKLITVVANNRGKANRSEQIWVSCAGCFCNCDNDGTAPVVRGLGSWEREEGKG